MPTDRAWHPHPMHRPGWLLSGILQTSVGAALLILALLDRPLLGDTTAAEILTFVIAGAAAATMLLPSGKRTGLLRLVIVVLVPLTALVIQLALLAQETAAPHPAIPVGAVLATAGVTTILWSERDRRRVRLEIEGDILTVFVRRYRLEHELPLEAVREVTAHRTLWGRTWGFGDFEARARKGTMKDRITKPVVGETPPDDATRGNGWDEEERFHIIAAHPYKGFRRELENRILLARMPPKERQEQELADRLAKDLQGLDA